MRIFAAAIALVLLGTGCVNLPFGEQAPEFPVEELDFMVGDGFNISQSAFALGLGVSATKHVTVEEHQSGKFAVLSWMMDVSRETAVSKTARDYALTHAPVGEASKLTEPV